MKNTTTTATATANDNDSSEGNGKSRSPRTTAVQFRGLDWTAEEVKSHRRCEKRRKGRQRRLRRIQEPRMKRCFLQHAASRGDDDEHGTGCIRKIRDMELCDALLKKAVERRVVAFAPGMTKAQKLGALAKKFDALNGDRVLSPLASAWMNDALESDLYPDLSPFDLRGAAKFGEVAFRHFPSDEIEKFAAALNSPPSAHDGGGGEGDRGERAVEEMIEGMENLKLARCDCRARDDALRSLHVMMTDAEAKKNLAKYFRFAFEGLAEYKNKRDGTMTKNDEGDDDCSGETTATTTARTTEAATSGIEEITSTSGTEEGCADKDDGGDDGSG